MALQLTYQPDLYLGRSIKKKKLDKLKKSEIEPNMQQIRETLALPEQVMLIPFSAEKGQGRELLLAEIVKLI